MIPALPGWVLAIPPLLFMGAAGACVGSFLNVVAYRLPRGEGLWSPGSRCPTCETPLTWRENFPIFGWLGLRGRCRFCRTPIAAEYPLVESGTALLVAGVYAAWFLGWSTGVGGDDRFAPDWARAGLVPALPYLVLVLTLLSGLIGMALIDARTYHIPVSIPWLVTGLALALHPAHAAWIEATRGALVRGGRFPWFIPTPPPEAPEVLAATLGAGAGLALSLGLLWTGAMRRSFADFEAWEREARAKEGAAGAERTIEGAPTWRQMVVRTLLLTGPAILMMATGAAAGKSVGLALEGMLGGALLGLVAGVFLRQWAVSREAAAAEPKAVVAGLQPARPWVGTAAGWLFVAGCCAAGWAISPAHGAMLAGLGVLAVVAARASGRIEAGGVWLEYPYARREMLREAAFLAPVVLGAMAGLELGAGIGWLATPPLWLQAGSGSLMGYLVGCGVVWVVRIGGTLAFGREAMGMGDVHLMGAVGAVAGWIDPVAAFVVGPAVALGGAGIGAVVRRLSGASAGAGGVAMPYGPSLALASAVCLLCKPWVEAVLSWLVHSPVRLP